MDLSIFFALKALAGVVGFSIGLVIGSLIAAIWLRLAASWLHLGSIPYLTAFKAAIISSFVVMSFNFSIGFNHGLTITIMNSLSSDGAARSFNPAFAYSPIYFIYAMIFGLLVTSALFCRMIPNNQGDGPLKFTDSLALASLYSGLSVAFLLLLGLIVYIVVIGILGIVG